MKVALFRLIVASWGCGWIVRLLVDRLAENAAGWKICVLTAMACVSAAIAVHAVWIVNTGMSK